jgi:exodeoxyribonuclease-3
MKIITWNINSIRLRLGLLLKLIEKENPDIICLQEIKVDKHLFPVKEINDLGFEYLAFEGEKSYNGVAILSKFEIKESFSLKLVNDHARHVAIRVADDIEIHNFYIPAGGDIPDIAQVKFKHKLDYCDQITQWFLENRSADDKLIITGDLNIAPLEFDVWSHKVLLKEVSHTPVEVDKLNIIMNSLSFVDILRKIYPEPKRLYSWWSYRNRDWKKSNRGRRLDHIWTTKILSDIVCDAYILEEVRDWERPSDHVPVVINLDREKNYAS